MSAALLSGVVLVTGGAGCTAIPACVKLLQSGRRAVVVDTTFVNTIRGHCGVSTQLSASAWRWQREKPDGFQAEQ